MSPAEPITLRPIRDDDRELLYRIYRSTREEEMALTGWSEDEVESFLRMQFGAQHAHYQEHFPDAQFDLILIGEEPVGRLYVHRRDDEIRIVDIALLTEHRRRGIGGALLRDLLDEGCRMRLPVRIHVERNNPALTLYERFGFVEIDEEGPYYLMERVPEGTD